MKRRTTLELDADLLVQAQRSLGTDTMRATVEEALRRATQPPSEVGSERRRRQIEYLKNIGQWADLEVLKSDEMWR